MNPKTINSLDALGINYIERIEILEKNKNYFDPMTESKYLDPGQEIFKVTKFFNSADNNWGLRAKKTK